MTKSKREIWHPAVSDQRVARAARALAEGVAGTDDQQLFMKWLIEVACHTYDEPFQPDNQNVTNYILGRRSVGLAVVKHINMSMSVFESRGETK